MLVSNIQKAFANGKAFIPFITCGDPNLETTAAVVRAAVKNMASLPKRLMLKALAAERTAMTDCARRGPTLTLSATIRFKR